MAKVRHITGNVYFTVSEADILEAPAFVGDLTETTVTVGESVNLVCQVTGQPQPIIRWTVDGKELKKTKDVVIESMPDGTQHLVIKSAKVEHAGKYKCIAENKQGKAESQAKVSVEGLSLGNILHFFLCVTTSNVPNFGHPEKSKISACISKRERN